MTHKNYSCLKYRKKNTHTFLKIYSRNVLTTNTRSFADCVEIVDNFGESAKYYFSTRKIFKPTSQAYSQDTPACRTRWLRLVWLDLRSLVAPYQPRSLPESNFFVKIGGKNYMTSPWSKIVPGVSRCCAENIVSVNRELKVSILACIMKMKKIYVISNRPLAFVINDHGDFMNQRTRLVENIAATPA